MSPFLFRALRLRRKYTAWNIIETLQNMEVASVQDLCYMSAYTGSKVLDALETCFNLRHDRKYYQPKELNKKIRSIT